MTIKTIGIVGAGTMGSGIALVALSADIKVVLYDISAAVLDTANAYIEKFLTKKDLAKNLKKLKLSSDLKDMAKVDIVIEAIVEKLSAKKELFAELDTICTKKAIFATNTSTIAVTAIAADTAIPERVIGMHFFNPAALMELVEVIRATHTSHETVSAVVKLTKELGKTPVICKDSPGFIVNRVARPYYLEAMRLVTERIATPEQIDTVMQLGGGFRMGPFRLLDLIGLDVSLASSTSIFEQTFYEPRFRPSLIQAQMVQAKKLGRKTGSGFYEYGEDATEQSLPEIPEKQSQQTRINVRTPNGLSNRAQQNGILVATSLRDAPYWVADSPAELPAVPAQERIILANAGTMLLREIQRHYSSRRVGVVNYDDFLLENAKLVTLVENDYFRESEIAEIESFFNKMGLAVMWVKDSPALILTRIIAQIINEASFVAGEGVADMQTIDTAMKLGVNYPAGPFEWAKQIGYNRVIAVLDMLYDYYHEERYRVAPFLRKLAND